MTGLPPLDRFDGQTYVRDLRTQYPVDLIGIPGADVRLSWSADSSSSDAALGHILSWSDDGTTWTDEEPVEGGHAIAVPAPGGAIPPGRARWYRVRIATDAGWSAPSTPLRVESDAGSFGDAALITTPEPLPLAGPVPYFRREFHLDAAATRARLRISSYGVHRVLLDGKPIADEHLSPGWTSYGQRILVATHDLTDRLDAGPHTLAVMVGDGWYRGRIGWTGSALYGGELAVVAELTVDDAAGRRVHIPTDDTWRVTQGGATKNSLYDGYEVDLGREPTGWDRVGFDDSTWARARVLDDDLTRFEPRIASPVRTVAELPGTLRSGTDSTRVDLPQNITGWLRLRVHGRRGDRVVVRHAEVLDADGALYTASLRTAQATDAYVLDRDGEHILEPHFTYHGFQYADVSGAAVLEATGVAISSATTTRSTFASGHAGLDRLHENVCWSLRDNFTSLPTDCPQRDERLGWTGDAQAFAATASTLVDSAAFWRSWMRDLANDQHTDGAVPSLVPNPLLLAGAEPDTYMQGRAGWADAATIVPWSVFESTGDDLILRESLPAARAWVGHLQTRSADTGFLPEEFQYGDWLDPDAPGDAPERAKTSSDFVAHAFFAWSARLLARFERRVGDAQRAHDADRLADAVAARTWNRWRDHALTTPTGCALAIEFGIAPAHEVAAVGARLAGLVRAVEGRIATGFLGTPHVLPALTRTGHLDEAYLMLLREESPSWLYEIARGATTVWERWDAIRADGTIHDGTMAEQGDVMLSFNHYAYGAVIDWVYRTVAGIAPDLADPGYATLVIAPRPAAAIGHARATIQTAAGEASTAWRLGDGDGAFALELEIRVPFGARARLDLPVTTESVVQCSHTQEPIEPTAVLPAGSHRLRVSAPRLAAPRGASR